MSEASPPEPRPARIVDLAPRDELNERFQRGLLHRGGRYQLQAEGGWRRGRVGIVRPEGPGEPTRLWLLQTLALGEEVVPPSGLSGDVVLALAMDALPAAEVVAQLEGVMKLPVVVYAPDGALGGPRGSAEPILRELRGTLAYPDDVLARQAPDRAYAQLGREQEAREFLRALRRITPRAGVTRFVVFTCAILWAQQVLMEGVSPTQPLASHLLAWGGMHSGTAALEPWRFLFAGQLHAGGVHLFVNLVILWQVGQFCERLFGNLAFAALYLFSVAAGFMLSAASAPLQVSVGASGGVFGVCGGVLAFMIRRRGTLPRVLVDREVRVFAVFVLAQFLLTGWMGQAVPIDHAGHLGGFVAGVVAGLALAPAMPPADPPSRRHLLAIPALALLLGLGAFGVARLPAVAFQARLVDGRQFRPALRAIELRRELEAALSRPTLDEAERDRLKNEILRTTIAVAASDASVGSPPVKKASLRLVAALQARLLATQEQAVGEVRLANPPRVAAAYNELAAVLAGP